MGAAVAQLVEKLSMNSGISSLIPCASWLHVEVYLDKTLKHNSVWHLSNNNFPKGLDKVCHYYYLLLHTLLSTCRFLIHPV